MSTLLDSRTLRLDSRRVVLPFVTIPKEVPMPTLTDWSAEDLLTACLWAGARGEPEEGQVAVCNVIVNRVKKKMAPGIRHVILEPRQFSWTERCMLRRSSYMGSCASLPTVRSSRTSEAPKGRLHSAECYRTSPTRCRRSSSLP